MKNKEIFKTKDEDGNEIELAVLRPSPAITVEAQTVYSKTWSSLVQNGVMVRAKMDKVLSEQGIWTEKDEKELGDLQKEILEINTKLSAGRNGYGSLEDAKAAAFSAKEKRNKVFSLGIRKNSLDENTADAQAEVARINYLIYACTVYNNSGKQYFKSLEDYYKRVQEVATMDAASALMNFIHDLDNNDFEKKYPENKFLLQYGFLDEKLRRVNKDGKLIDSEGRLINEDGRYIDNDGNFININGDRVDENGDVIPVNFAPFLDENGQEINPKV